MSIFGAGEWVGLENYETVLQDYRFWDSLRVTLIYLVIALPLQVALGFGIAFLINAEWGGRGLTRALFIIPMVVAPVVAGGIWRMILDPLWGFMNYVLGLVGLGPFDWFGDPHVGDGHHHHHRHLALDSLYRADRHRGAACAAT